MRRTKTRYSRAGLIIARDYERCFSTKCHHVSNDDYYGTPFMLEPFQRENIWKPIFATGRVVNGEFRRKYHRAIIGLPSGYGKTELAAGMLLTIATMEPIYNGQYGLVASSKDQVANVYEKISTMIHLDDDWDSQWEVGKSQITHRETGAKIMVFPNKAAALESWHLNVVIFDELHVYPDSKVWDAGLKGQKVLKDPLAIGITTAGDAREGFLWETLERADSDPGLYLYWLGLNDRDNINHKRSWEKLLVASWVTWDDIQDQRGSATSDRSFERYTANRFPKDNVAEACFSDIQLNRLMKNANDFDLTKPFALGIDGATAGDSFAIVAYQEIDGKGLTKEWIFDKPTTDDGHYPLNEILELIAGIWQEYYPRVVGIDPNRLLVMSHQLQDNYGVEIVSFAQTNPIMCQASALVANAVKGRRLRLKGCPKLKAHLSHTVKADREPYGWRFNKAEPSKKIDGAIALGIAMLAYEELVKGKEDFVVPF